MSFAGIFTQEKDLKKKNTKKVKKRKEVYLNQPSDIMEIVSSDHQEGVEITPKVSYRDSLLSLFGIHINIVNEPIAITDEDEFDPENRWYKDEIGSLKKEKPFDPCSVISVTQEEFAEWCKPWKAALIVRVLGKRVSLGFMKQRLKRDWARKSKLSDDYSYTLLGEPWMIAGHYFIVQRWRPFFLESEKEVRKVAAWIRILNLPIELYNPKFLWRVGSTIGSMLKIDKTMSIHSRDKFVWIFVEINLSKQLVPRISVLESILNIEYKSLHMICFRCEKYGHKSEVCSEMLDSNKNHHVEEVTRGSGSVNQNVSQATWGPHHELKKSRKGFSNGKYIQANMERKDPNPDHALEKGSFFNIL
ncbi:hypothetical protein Ahy_A08g040597 [Arachis hypogaea]|uniref:Uncharacterized protein n=1 Tax=Arachis hypogaea TaxID=3818 RepID=A0A445C0D1_ARAHY|nr:hypothetical protein Ahy_A08g040597 [Arachis hypogaea]